MESKCSIPFACGIWLVLDFLTVHFSYLKRRVEGKEHVAEGEGMLHLLPDLPGLWPLVALFPGFCLSTQAGQCGHTSPSFLIGSSNEDEGWGLVSSTT